MQIDEARERLEAQGNAPELALSAAARAHYANVLAADDAKRAAMPTREAMEAEQEQILQKFEDGEVGSNQGLFAMIHASTDYELMLGARDFYRKNRTRRLAALRASFAYGETRWIEPAVRQYIADSTLDLAAGSPDWLDLANALQRAEIEAMEHSLERDRGDYSSQPRDPLLTAPDPEPDPGRFRRSRTVAAHFGLTPRRFQSGEHDNPGRISKAGDRDVRATEAENVCCAI